MVSNMSDESLNRPKQTRAPNSLGDTGSSPPGPFPRLRAKTVPAAVVVSVDDPGVPLMASGHEITEDGTDVFDRRDSTLSSNESNDGPIDSSIHDLPDQFSELPIELISLTDRFINSLTTKSFSTPPSIDQLSDLFQEFYQRAASHITTHVSTLALRLNRDDPPSPSLSQTSKNSKGTQSSNHGSQRGKPGPPSRSLSEQQMLTATEVEERRKARKLLKYKQHALEESVERRACESIYEKIWRHRSTIDEMRDEKLRSKTAALSVMAIRLSDLGVDISRGDENEALNPKEWLATARHNLMQMNEEKFPLGKLQCLTAAHKAIVDALTNILPSSSSADEILPTLIYTLILSPPEGINITSNLLFIQRFRASNKIDGETAYCLTNLEAAVSFLENVDLASLNADDSSTGLQLESSDLPVSSHTSAEPLRGEIGNHTSTPGTPLATGSNNNTGLRASTKASPTPVHSTQQRLTNLFQPPAKALGAANDIVRNTADQGLKNISSTLDNSFNFLFGRLKEVQTSQRGGAHSSISIVPKTLDDARRLVRTASGIPDDCSEDGSVRDNLTPVASAPPRARLDDRLAELVGGRRTPSTQRSSSRSNPRTGYSGNADGIDGKTKSDEPLSNTKPTSAAGSTSQTPNPPFGSVRNFGNTLNPLSHIPSMIRGLGRNAPETSQNTSIGDNSRLTEKDPGVPSANSPATFKFDPPIKRFLEMEDPSGLKLGDIPELLEDYKRLGMILNSLQSS